MTDTYTHEDVLAAVAEAYEKAINAVRQDARNGDLSDGAAQWAIDTIRALTPADAIAALEERDKRMKAEGRAEGLREAAEIAKIHNLGRDHECSKRQIKAILARAAEIEGAAPMSDCIHMTAEMAAQCPTCNPHPAPDKLNAALYPAPNGQRAILARAAEIEGDG